MTVYVTGCQHYSFEIWVMCQMNKMAEFVETLGCFAHCIHYSTLWSYNATMCVSQNIQDIPVFIWVLKLRIPEDA